jgi:hypothetical protein
MGTMIEAGDVANFISWLWLDLKIMFNLTRSRIYTLTFELTRDYIQTVKEERNH